MLASVRDANASGAARRRQRRLRQWLRHERLSVAMALAEYNHHSALRRPTMARARGEEREMYNATGQTTPVPRAASTNCTSAWMTTRMCLPPGRWLLMSSGRGCGFCGAPWSSLETSFLWFLLSPILRRRWWTSWWKCLPATIRRLPTRLSKCPRSPAPPPLWSYCSLYAADGGTAGDSVDDPLLSQADRWHSWSIWVLKGFSQNSVVLPWCSEWSSRCFPRTEFNSVWWSRSSISDCRAEC